MLYKFYQQHIFPHLLNQVMQVPSLMDQHRELLLQVEGEVLEIGFGTGINVPFYQNVNTLYALEPSAEIYHLSQDRVCQANFDIQHIQASAEKLPFADQSLDHIVSTWTLCSISHLDQALDEIHRVLKPTGTFHIVEHVLHNNNATVRCLQHALTPLQKRVAGCHLNRNMDALLTQHHFKFIQQDYFDAQGIPKIGQRMLRARLQKI